MGLPMGEYLNEFMTVVRYHFADFKSRARRRQYWMFTLMSIIIALAFSWPIFVPVFGVLPNPAQMKVMMILTGIAYLIGLILYIPSLSVAVRRLHDTGRTGKLVLLGFVPLAQFVLLYFLIQDSQPGTNQWGPNPKEVEAGIVSPNGAQNFDDVALEDW